MTSLETLILASYFFVLLILAVYGWHRYYMVYLYMRHKDERPVPKSQFTDLPVVTIQLPFFNEMYVAERLIDAVADIEYPRDRLEIQVLDDSTDETRAIAERAVQRLAATGLDIHYLHRTDRTGYKAGALDAGLKQARGQFVAIFDADFLPRPDFLLRTVHYFTDPKVAMVQARWGHINEDFSLLTRIQAILLDAHFVLEHGSRNLGGCFFNFNGTAGIWRREAIADGGGWQHDTLTEDLDLSFRAVLRGWRGRYAAHEGVAGELPRDVVSYKRQQARWARGTIQTTRKLLGPLLRSTLAPHRRLAGALHLTGYFVHPLILVTSLTTPLLLMQPQEFSGPAGLLGLLSAAPLLSMLLASHARGRTIGEFLRDLPAALLLGVGMAFSNTVAMAAALRTRETGEFARTPKGAPNAYRLHPDRTMWGEFALALYAICAMLVLVADGAWQSAAPLLLYALGYGGVWAAQMCSALRTRP